MITYEDAYKKAKELKPNIDACDEYDIAYAFKVEAEKYNIGGDGQCVIMKDTGDAIGQTVFFTEYDAKFIKQIPMKQ